MKKFSMKMILVISLLLVAPAFAADGAPPTKALAAKVAPAPTPADAKAVAAPVVAPTGETKPAEPKALPAAPVVAEKASEVTWWKVLLANSMELAFTLLGLLLSGLVTVLMRKYGFEAQSAKANELLGKAIGYAEQKAVKAAKLEEGKKTSGAEKMELAVQFAEKLSKDYKLQKKGKDWWEDNLESWMGVKKNGVSS